MKTTYRTRLFVLPVAVLAVLCGQSQEQGRDNKGPVIVTDQNALKVETRRIGNCTQQVPTGWQTDTNKEGSAMDLTAPDKSMYAGYGILAVNTRMGAWYDRELYNAKPERSVLRIASMIAKNVFGENALRYTDDINQQVGDYQLRSFAGNNCRGIVLYRIFPGDGFNFNYIEASRFAMTRSDLWDQKGELVMGIAASIVCSTMLVQHEEPKLPRSSSLKPSAAKSKKDDYGYNPQLGTEYCHNPRTGENFRVSPGLHWSETGPDGPGYYGMAGNERIKMAPGRSD